MANPTPYRHEGGASSFATRRVTFQKERLE